MPDRSAPLNLDALDFDKSGGVVTVVAQDAATGCVLMIAHADRQALALSQSTGEMHYRSRTRGLWHKGATSGAVQRVVSLTPDCDGDAVLARVLPAGPACHTGAATCFGDVAHADAVSALDRVVDARRREPGSSGYTRRLLGDRNLRLKKIGEESAELVVAIADGEGGRAVAEAADLVYHVVVALHAAGRTWAEVQQELARRRLPVSEAPRSLSASPPPGP